MVTAAAMRSVRVTQRSPAAQPVDTVPRPFVYTNSAANVSGHYKTDPSFELPDVSIVEIELPYASETIAKEFPAPPTPGPSAPAWSRRRVAARCGSGPPTRTTGRSWTCGS